MRDAVPVLVERSNTNDAAVTVVRWRVASGAAIARAASLVEVETSKANVEIVAPADGFVFYALDVGDEVPVGEPVAWIAETATFTLPTREVAAAESAGAIEFTRKARKLMRELGLAERDFTGLAVVREEDVLARSGRPAPSVPVDSNPGVPSSVRPLGIAKAHEVRMLRGAHRATVYSKVVREVPLALVKQVIESYQAKEGLGLSLGEAVSHAATQALKKWPLLNACAVEEGIRTYEAVHLGVAMNVGELGLRVPVVHDADRLTLRELSLAVKGLSLKYMRGKLAPADLASGTFTVTDLSSLGVQSFDPVINAGQSAILGIGAPFLSGHAFNLVLAFDHCVLDGMIGAQYLEALVTCLASASERNR